MYKRGEINKISMSKLRFIGFKLRGKLNKDIYQVIGGESQNIDENTKLS